LQIFQIKIAGKNEYFVKIFRILELFSRKNADRFLKKTKNQ